MAWQDVATIVGLVLTFVGLPITFVVGRRTRQKPSLKFTIDHQVLIEPEVGHLAEGLELSFEGAEIERLSRTYLAVWNDRGDTVRGSDIVNGDPLRLQVEPDQFILQTTMRFWSRASTGIAASIDRHKAPLTFDFLDEGDGAIIEVLHSGKSAPQIQGTVRGASMSVVDLKTSLAPSYLRRVLDKKTRRRARLSFVGGLVFVFIFVGSVGALFFDSFFIKETRQLIDASDFDLETTDGQANFAATVDDVNDDKLDLLDSGFYVPLACLGSASVIIFLGMRVILLNALPRSVLNNDLTREPSRLDPEATS